MVLKGDPLGMIELLHAVGFGDLLDIRRTVLRVFGHGPILEPLAARGQWHLVPSLAKFLSRNPQMVAAQ